MHRQGWTIIFATCMLASVGRGAVAQTPAPDSMRSTLSGVFTAGQATRGEEIHAGMCRSCHTGATPTPTFKEKWAGRPLSELFEYVSNEMPKNSPGSLNPQDYTLVLAYILHTIGMPAGKVEL